jgi:hypothetical protein
MFNDYEITFIVLYYTDHIQKCLVLYKKTKTGQMQWRWKWLPRNTSKGGQGHTPVCG